MLDTPSILLSKAVLDRCSEEVRIGDSLFFPILLILYFPSSHSLFTTAKEAKNLFKDSKGICIGVGNEKKKKKKGRKKKHLKNFVQEVLQLLCSMKKTRQLANFILETTSFTTEPKSSWVAVKSMTLLAMLSVSCFVFQEKKS